MKSIRTVIFLIASFQVHGQTIVIDEGIYKSYFSSTLKEPLYVVYRLYQGGGKCSRKHFHFKVTRQGTATPEDYLHSGYEEGHLANAEDFANDCAKEIKTFEFFNCLPQTLKLNRGIWKTWETKIRKESRTKHLLIICGGIFGAKKIGHEVAVPDYCWKIVYDKDSNKLLYCLLFPNDNSDSVNTTISLTGLKARLGYDLSID
jgi:endonuclease G, mitochondrial